MFTGIISDVGEIVAKADRVAGVRLTIATAYDPATIDLGASIACSGACLTVVERGVAAGRNTFDVEASSETLAKTTMARWTVGHRLNLERALKLGDELGGHMVTGHVDAVATIVARDNEADMARFTFEVPSAFAKFVAPKGSVALDGTSLTVNEVEEARFTVMMIPHTLAMTTWGAAKAGDQVNFEVDLMARYVARLAETR